jgi:hypothetical protein
MVGSTPGASINSPLTAPAEVALKLQRPLPDDMLQIVAEGARSDQLEDGRAAGSRA